MAAALLVLAAGCGGAPSPGEADAGGSVPTAHTGREGDGWTVLHYSMADTDLEPFMVGDLNELGAVGSNDNLQVRELMDRSPDYGADPALDQGDWVGARVLDLGPAGTSELVEDLGDVDSADPATLADFVAEGIEAHRAGHYALVISDHGASWPGVGPDDGTGEVLDLADLTRGISEGLERAGVDKLDLLGFDACLMASYEVASAVAPLADRLVASQELEPGHGWDYGALRLLAEDPDATADQLGAALLDGFVAQAEAEGTADGITLGLVDLTRMDEVDAAMAAFSGALAERAVAVAPVVGRAGAETLGFARSPDEAEDSHMKDLGLLATTIGVEALDVSDEADALVRARSATPSSPRSTAPPPGAPPACRSTSLPPPSWPTGPISTSPPPSPGPTSSPPTTTPAHRSPPRRPRSSPTWPTARWWSWRTAASTSPRSTTSWARPTSPTPRSPTPSSSPTAR